MGEPAREVARLRGGSVGGACCRGGSSKSNVAVASATLRTAHSNASNVRLDAACTPLTFRTYCRAAASISSGVAAGCSPRRVVMFRHIATTVWTKSPHADEPRNTRRVQSKLSDMSPIA